MSFRPTKKGRALLRTRKFKKSLGQEVKGLKRAIKRTTEKKHHDVTISDNYGNDATINNLCLVPQSDTSGGMDGLTIFGKTLWVNYSVQWKITATQETSCRTIIFVDKRSNGAVPTIAELMEANPGVDSLYNNVNEGSRFIVLYDKLHHNAFPDSTTSISKSHHVRLNVNRKMRFLNSGETATALGENMIYVIFIADTTSADADTPTVTGNARLYFNP